MKILGIETSCDETAVAIIEAQGDINSPFFKLLGSALHSQIEMHREFGGVVPNLAKREHQKNLPIVLGEALEEANLKLEDIDKIAVTVGPGLEPALWVGITFAQELSEKYGKVLIATNHMEGHIASVLLSGEVIEFPALALLISGGHTELVLMEGWKPASPSSRNKKMLGETVDDAAGEAFDKVARMLGLPYPGGPEISRLAKLAREKNIIADFKLPRPMIHSGDYNFSFSGLKTAVLYHLRDFPKDTEEGKMALAREFEDAVAEVLISKTKKALEEFGPKTLVIGGGVIANDKIRGDFEKLMEDYPETKLLIPEKSLTTDNAVMIAIAGYITHLTGEKIELKARGNLSFD